MTKPQLYCPCCQDQTLQTIEMHGQQVDRCQRCNGLWFDDRELSDAIAHGSELTDPPIIFVIMSRYCSIGIAIPVCAS